MNEDRPHSGDVQPGQASGDGTAPPTDLRRFKPETRVTNQKALPTVALITSVAALSVSAISSVVYITLIIMYENDALNGDGFILPLPLFSWLFIVLPLCVIATILTLIGCMMQTVTQRTGLHFILIVLALPLLPILLVFALSFVARFP